MSTNHLLLHDIRSVHNVGALFRTAEAAGILKIILAGVTPGPLDRFGRERKDFAKAALGAEKMVKWERTEDAVSTLQALKREGFYIIAVEQSPVSVDYKKVTVKEKTLFVLGNEVEGIPENVLNECDVIAEIPLKGEKESLNVSVAGGIALFRMLGL